jgi:hypothetical protein
MMEINEWRDHFDVDLKNYNKLSLEHVQKFFLKQLPF